MRGREVWPYFWFNRASKISFEFAQLSSQSPAPTGDPERWDLLLLITRAYDALHGQWGVTRRSPLPH